MKGVKWPEEKFQLNELFWWIPGEMMRHRRSMLFPPGTVQEKQRAMNILVAHKYQSKILECVHIAEHLFDVLRYRGVEQSFSS